MANETCYNGTLEELVDATISSYKCSDKGLLLPLVNEYTWPIPFRAFIYFIGMLWSFLGIAIIADVFMCGIETITSKTRKIKVPNPEAEGGADEFEIRIWNGTVANLTLMALGSSAPEILLSIIETVGNKFEAGELGPNTIVGSASFNLLCIIAICIIAIPTPQVRRIDAIQVFAITAFFSIFAYVWMLIVLVAITPDEVDLWEAIVTFLLFPILVILAWSADRNFFRKPKKKTDEDAEMRMMLGDKSTQKNGNKEKITPNELESKYVPSEYEGLQRDVAINADKMRDIVKELKLANPLLAPEDIAKLATAKIQDEESHSRMWYRINATRTIGGAHKLNQTFQETLAEIYENHMKSKVFEIDEEMHNVPSEIFKMDVDMSHGNQKSVIEFTTARTAILENEKKVRLHIHRFGKTSNPVTFRVDTIDGTADAQSDYIPFHEKMTLAANETATSFDVTIIDDNEWEPDEVFFVKLSLDNNEIRNGVVLGKKSIVEVTIINDDDPGTFQFTKSSFIYKENCGTANLPVERINGADGKVTVSWRTSDMSAISGKDYEGGEGKLEFDHGEVLKYIEIPIVDDEEFEKDEHFKVTLTEISPAGAKLGKITKTIVTVLNDDDFKDVMNRLVNLTNMNLDALRVDTTTWGQQFRNAMNVNGGELDTATKMDYVMHFLTFGWKLIFALAPPPSILGGWPCFCTALVMIGVLTAITGDLASIFGCLIGLKDSVTAITFVAMGTSLPDLFASRQAAKVEKNADNAIGNVTGSNSVNVFLGLGTPWVLAAIYWNVKEGKSYHYPAGSLSFSVVVYTIVAVICLAVMFARRYLAIFGKGELGGPTVPKWFCAILFLILWIVYIMLSSLQAYGHIAGF